ncbi:MAG: hypothetical protein J7L30_04175 [Methanophagales archaeon]|nr:hypothetical protein [Methanophagales archaeon]UYZ40038.1 MAG: hypothetical protein N2V74_07575 [Candidatus Methanospirare jalkutatii]
MSGEVERLGVVELQTRKSVRRGERTSIESLFSYGERRKQFELEADVRRWRTKVRVKILLKPPEEALGVLKSWREGIKIEIPKLGSLTTLADITKKRGEKTSLNGILASTARRTPFFAEESVSAGESVLCHLEILP